MLNVSYKVAISKKGTITIPAAVRNALGIKPGQRARQSPEGDKIVIRFDAGTKKIDLLKEQECLNR